MSNTPKLPRRTILKKKVYETIPLKFEGEERSAEELEMFKKKLIEDDRMDSIFRMGENLTEKFDNRTYLHPHGMTDFDYKGISEQRRHQFEKFKHNTRHEIYAYMSEHKEVDALLALFFKKILLAKPLDSVHFAAEYFTTTTLENGYKALMEQEIERLSRYRVAKMKAAGKITTLSIHEEPEKIKNTKVDPCASKKKEEVKVDKQEDLSIDPLEAMKLQEGVLNWIKKLNIGPLAQDFDAHKAISPVVEIKPAPKKKKKVYCGCKDPGRREIAHPKKRPIKSKLKVPPTSSEVEPVTAVEEEVVPPEDTEVEDTENIEEEVEPNEGSSGASDNNTQPSTASNDDADGIGYDSDGYDYDDY